MSNKLQQQVQSDGRSFIERHPWVVLMCYFPPIWIFGAGIRFGMEAVMSIFGIEPSFEGILTWPNEVYRDLRES